MYIDTLNHVYKTNLMSTIVDCVVGKTKPTVYKTNLMSTIVDWKGTTKRYHGQVKFIKSI